MPAKISKEVRQMIYELNEEGKPVRQILTILKSEGIKISDKSIYNILKEKTKNQSLASFDEDEEEEKVSEKISGQFNETFDEEDIILPTLTREHMTEEKTHQQEDDNKNNNIKDNLFTLIDQGVKEGTEQVISMLNKGNQKEPIIEEIKSSNDKLDEIINETKKKVNKPYP